MDIPVNKKNVKGASFSEYEMKYDTVVVSLNDGYDTYPHVVASHTSTSDFYPFFSFGTNIFDYDVAVGKWKFQSNYYTLIEMTQQFHLSYWLVSNDSEKDGDRINVYKLQKGNIIYCTAEYKRVGKTFFAKLNMVNAAFAYGTTESGTSYYYGPAYTIARNVIGKEPYSYKFDGLVYPPFMDFEDSIKFGGQTYAYGNSTVKFAKAPFSSMEYPEQSEGDDSEAIHMSSSESNSIREDAQDAANYDDIITKVNGLEEQKMDRHHWQSTVGVATWLEWHFWDDWLEISTTRPRPNQAPLVDVRVLHITNESVNKCYFAGHVYAGMIQAGIIDGENKGYINGGMIDSSIGTANCDSSITTPLGYASSHQNTLSGSVKNYNPWFSSVYVGDNKVQFAPKQITYKDENGDDQTITVLAQVTS